jgi:hypothetical protein
MTVAIEERIEEAPEADGSGRVALGIVAATWVAILALLLRHREIISSDTLSNYVHVWYIADRVWDGHSLPFAMPVLAHGDALAFPYGAIPWLAAVLLWPVMHEWSVTACLGIGFVAMVATTFWAFPEVRRGWWAVGVLLNPALAMGLLLGQLPFMWAVSMLLGAIGFWRRGRRGWATALAALAQLTHAPVLVPMVAAVMLLQLRHEHERQERRDLMVRWLVSVAIALPAIVLVFLSPVTGETSPLISVWIEVETLFLRSLVVAIPIGMIIVMRRSGASRRVAMGIAVLLLLGQVAVALGAGMRVGWGAMFRTPNASASALPHSTHFEPGRTYRVLSQADGKYAPYAAVRAGANLDSEFFPESLHWRSFKDVADYERFLAARHIDFVAIYQKYDRRRTNEKALLEQMAKAGCASVVERTVDYDLYSIGRLDCR